MSGSSWSPAQRAPTVAPPSAWGPTPRRWRATSTRAATTTGCGAPSHRCPTSTHRSPRTSPSSSACGRRSSPWSTAPAAGVGLVIACFADVRFAVRGAKLTTAAPKLGFPAEYGLSWLLPRLVGAGRAADWLLSGRVFLTDEAGEVGLFSAVAPGRRAGGPRRRLRHRPGATTCRRPRSPPRRRRLWGDLLHDDPADSVRRSMALLREMSTGPDFVEGSRRCPSGAGRSSDQRPSSASTSSVCSPRPGTPRRGPTGVAEKSTGVMTPRWAAEP